MKRKRTFKKADAILTGDIEIRAFQPTCRTDNHWEAQERKMKWLCELQQKHDCPVLDSGDLFDKKYKVHPSNELTRWAGYHIPDNFHTVPGNHDLPGKTYENYSNSAMAVLEMAGKLSHYSGGYLLYSDCVGSVVSGFEWGRSIKQEERYNIECPAIALVHAMIYEEFEPFPGCIGHSVKETMDLLPDYDLIVTGHNHQTFVLEKNGRVLVNPGSFMRNDADQADHKPCVFLWYADSNKVEQVFVPIEKDVITRDHIDIKKEKEHRIDAFVEKLGEQATTGVDFGVNLEVNIKSGDVPKGVENKVWEYYEGV